MKNAETPFAVFVVCPFDCGDGILLAVTTRDGKDAGRIGLPGGKVDLGENPVAAAIREASEEGWNVEIEPNVDPIHMAIVDGKEVWWFAGYNASKREAWKEQARGITPELASLAAVVKSGYGNEWLEGVEYALACHALMAINTSLIK